MKHIVLIAALFSSALLVNTQAFAQSAADKSKVLAANDQFYKAFTAGDLELMRGVWSTSQPTGMTPPGSRFLKGNEEIMQVFERMFARPISLECELLDFEFKQGKAIVICDEKLTNSSGKMMNVFGPDSDGEEKEWKMLYHGPVPKGWNKS